MSEHLQSDGAPGAERIVECVLSNEDAAALEALIGSWQTPSAIPVGVSDRSARLSEVLALLDCGRGPGEVNDPTLMDVTLARVARLRIGARAMGEPILVPDDEDALEALVASGFEARRVSAAVRARAEKQLSLLGMLGAAPASFGSADLVERTLSKVQTAIDSSEGRLVLNARPGWGFGRVRRSDLVSAAALLLVAAALFAPVFESIREKSRQSACAGNMAAAGFGFGAYANDNRNMLPLATPSLAGRPWWNTGKRVDQSNSANLYLLSRNDRYATLHDLSCPGNRQARSEAPAGAQDWTCVEEVSFSMQNMYASERPAWNGAGRMVVLADASPVVRRAVRHELIYPFENSFNHGGKGQEVLWNDGSTEWLTSPVLGNNDNIWLPRSIERAIANVQQGRPPTAADPLLGTESPANASDSFVGP